MSPFKSKFKITQGFGENPEYYKQYGLRAHEGGDYIPTDSDWSILALEDGIVVKDENNPKSGAYGVNVTIWHPKIKKATQYCHLEANQVSLNESVKKGRIIGKMGKSGNTTGPHLHLNLFEVDEEGYRLNRDNGYFGGIDPLPFLESLDFPEDSSNIDIQNMPITDQFRIPGRLLSSQDHPVNEEFLEIQQIRGALSEFGRLKESHIGALRNLETKEKELATAKGTIRIRDETINDLAIKLEKLQSSLDMPPEPAEAPENTGNETQPPEDSFPLGDGIIPLINWFKRIIKRIIKLG